MKEHFGTETVDSLAPDADIVDSTEEYRAKKPKKHTIVVKKKRKLLDNRPNPEQDAAVAETIELSKDMDTLVRKGVSKAHKAGNRRKKQELMGTYSEIEKKLDSMPIEVIERANTRLKTARAAKKQKKDEQINKIQENLAAIDIQEVKPEEKPLPAPEIVAEPEIISQKEAEPAQKIGAEEKIESIPTPPEAPTIEIAAETPITFETTPETVKKSGFFSYLRTMGSKLKKFISQVSQKESVAYYKDRGLIGTAEDRDNEELSETFIAPTQSMTPPIEKSAPPEPEIIASHVETPIEVSERDIVAWEGDWEDDERPDGYRDIENLHEAAQARGFDVDSALGDGFLENYIHTVENAKKGSLTANELSELISKNSQFHEALQEFKKQYQASHPRKSRKVLPSPDASIADKADTLPAEQSETGVA